MKNRLGKKNIFNPIVQDLEKHSSTAQQLASRGWHRVNNREELQPGGGRRVGDGRAEGSSAKGDGGKAIVSLTPDVDATAGVDSIYPLK